MKLDTAQPLATFTGEAIHDAGGPATLGTVIVAALLAAHPNDAPSTEEKLWRYNLARRIHENAQVEISDEEAALIRCLIGKSYAVAVVGAVHQAIEQGGQHVPH